MDRPVPPPSPHPRSPSIRFNTGVNTSITTPAPTDEITNTKKKSASPPSRNHPYHGNRNVPFSIFSTCPAICPPVQFAIAFDRKNIPIKNDAYRTGATRVTKLNPVGEMHNSPSVCIVYVAISQNMLARLSTVVPNAPTTINTYPPPRNISPIAIFIG